MSAPTGKYFRRNFSLGVVNGVFMNLGMAFIDPVTVLPVFITKLGGSAALIGLVSAVHGVGWFLPQIFASRVAETRSHLLNMYRVVVGVRSLLLAGAAVSVLLIDASQAGLLLTVFVLLFWFGHLAGGVSAIPFLEIVSKTIPVTSRGKFFGTRRLIGGLLGIGAGMVVGIILNDTTEQLFMTGPLFEGLKAALARAGLVGRPFPTDFGVIFLFGWLCISLGGLVFSFAGEVPARSVEKSARIVDDLRAGFSLIRNDASYRRFYVVRICWQFTAMALPFYTIYAYDVLHFSENFVGLFLSVLIGSGVVSNFVWGRVLDNQGNKIVLLVTAALSLIPPVAVLAIDRFTGSGTIERNGAMLLLAVCATFALNGSVRSGRVITNITYLLEFAPEAKRPLYVGFMNSFSSPFMLSPLIGGLIVQFFGYQVLFVVCGLFAIANVLLSFGLKEPRQSQS